VPSRSAPDGVTLLAVACYAASAAVCWVASTGHAPFGDLRIYRSGGAAVLHGARLYDLRFAWNLGFTYPPFAALVFTLLAATPWPVVPPIVTGISVVLLPVTLWLALRLPRRPRGPRAPRGARGSRGPRGARAPRGTRRSARTAPNDRPPAGDSRPGPRLDGRRAVRLALAGAAVAVWLEPVRTNLAYGQINLVITALILFDLSREDPARLKGAAIGLAAGLKLTPAIFVVYLAMTGRYRAAAVSAATFAVTVAAGFAVDPSDSTQFWARTFANPERIGRIENAANQSLRGALARVLHTTNVQPWWLIAAVTVGLAGLGLAAAAGRSGDEAAGFSLCAVTALLVSPVSWSHHWVLAVPALLVLAVSAWRSRSAWLMTATTALAVTGWSRIIWQVPIGQGQHAELHLDPLQLGYSDAYVAAGLAVLAVAGSRLARERLARERLARESRAVRERPRDGGDPDAVVVAAAHGAE
jgi:hypothetical protein